MRDASLIGIDLGGTNCRAALVTESGQLLGLRRMETRADEGLDSLLERVVVLCRELTSEATEGGLTVRAVGLGSPGVIAPDGTVLSSPNLPLLNGLCLPSQIAERIDLPVALFNDANAAAWGEGRFGAGRPFSSFIALTLGTGVGGGLVLGGRLWSGADGAAGEAGHLMVEPEGRPCGCGSRGCLEQNASATGIARTFRERLAAEGHASWGGRPLAAATSAVIAEAAREGDSAARFAFSEAGRRLGQALAGVANLLNLEAALITGGAASGLDLMRLDLEGELRDRAFAVAAHRMQIIPGELGDRAGILGAADLARNALLDRGVC